MIEGKHNYEEVTKDLKTQDDSDIFDKIIEEGLTWQETIQHTHVSAIDLKPMYMKVQKKLSRRSEQRIEDGMVNFTVTASFQISKVRVFVQRFYDWIDENLVWERHVKGWFELKTKVTGHKMTNYYYQVDLDSVYRTEKGKKVYELERDKGEERNQWLLFIAIELVDQTSKEFLFGPFSLKTKCSNVKSKKKQIYKLI